MKRVLRWYPALLLVAGTAAFAQEARVAGHGADLGAFQPRGEQVPDGIVLTSSIPDSLRFGTSDAKAVQDRDGSPLHPHEGGRTPGTDCEASAHHGFNGLERQVVGDIPAWIKARP